MVLALGLLIVTASIAGEAPKPATSEVASLAIPGAPADGVSLDFLAVDRVRHQVWVPAGDIGNALVIDT